MIELNKKFYLKTFRPDRQHSYFLLSNIIMELWAPDSVIDFGCGLGWLLYYLKKYFNIQKLMGIEPNLEIQYIDSDTKLKEYVGESIYPISLKYPIHLKEKFDVSVSLEVLEHMEDKYADVAIDNICRHSDNVMFSAAYPGQGGWGHINEQPKEYWLEKFKLHNFNLQEEITNKVSLTLRNYGAKPWYWTNIMIFEKEV